MPRKKDKWYVYSLTNGDSAIVRTWKESLNKVFKSSGAWHTSCESEDEASAKMEEYRLLREEEAKAAAAEEEKKAKIERKTKEAKGAAAKKKKESAEAAEAAKTAKSGRRTATPSRKVMPVKNVKKNAHESMQMFIHLRNDDNGGAFDEATNPGGITKGQGGKWRPDEGFNVDGYDEKLTLLEEMSHAQDVKAFMTAVLEQATSKSVTVEVGQSPPAGGAGQEMGTTRMDEWETDEIHVIEAEPKEEGGAVLEVDQRNAERAKTQADLIADDAIYGFGNPDGMGQSEDDDTEPQVADGGTHGSPATPGIGQQRRRGEECNVSPSPVAATGGGKHQIGNGKRARQVLSVSPTLDDSEGRHKRFDGAGCAEPDDGEAGPAAPDEGDEEQRLAESYAQKLEQVMFEEMQAKLAEGDAETEDDEDQEGWQTVQPRNDRSHLQRTASGTDRAEAVKAAEKDAQARRMEKERQAKVKAKQNHAAQHWRRTTPWKAGQKVKVKWDGKWYRGKLGAMLKSEGEKLKVVFDAKTSAGGVEFDWYKKKDIIRIVPDEALEVDLASPIEKAKSKARGTKKKVWHQDDCKVCDSTKCKACKKGKDPKTCPYEGCSVHGAWMDKAALINHLVSKHTAIEIDEQGKETQVPACHRDPEAVARLTETDVCPVCRFPSDGPNHIECNGRGKAPNMMEMPVMYEMPLEERDESARLAQAYTPRGTADLLAGWTEPMLAEQDNNTIRRPAISAAHAKMMSRMLMQYLHNYMDSEGQEAALNMIMGMAVMPRVIFQSKPEFAKMVGDSAEESIAAVVHKRIEKWYGGGAKEMLQEYLERKSEREQKYQEQARADEERGIKHKVVNAELVANLIAKEDYKSVTRLLEAQVASEGMGGVGQTWLNVEDHYEEFIAGRRPLVPPQKDQAGNALAKDEFKGAIKAIKFTADGITATKLQNAAQKQNWNKSAGTGGTRAEHWKLMLTDRAMAQALASALQDVLKHGANQYLPDQTIKAKMVRDHLTAVKPGAISKPNKPGKAREVGCPPALMKLVQSVTVKPLKEQVRSRTKHASTLANDEGNAAAAISVQQFQDATLRSTRRELADPARDINTFAEMMVSIEFDAKSMYPWTDRPEMLQQLADEPALTGMYAMAVFQYSTETKCWYEFDRDGGSMESAIENGGTIGDTLIGEIAKIAITRDIEHVTAFLGEKMAKMSIMVSTDNMIVKGKLEDCMVVVEAFEEMYEKGETHYRYPRSDRVYHRKIMLDDDMQDDGLDGSMPTQQQMNDGVSAVYARQFPDKPKYDISVHTRVARVLGVPVLTKGGIQEWLMAKVQEKEKVIKAMLAVPNVDPADVHAWIKNSMSKVLDHLAIAVAPDCFKQAAQKFDNVIVSAYETILHDAGAGAMVRAKKLLSKRAVEMMHCRADDEQNGMGINSLLNQSDAGVWIAGMKAGRALDKATKSPHQKMVNAYVDKQVVPKMQKIIDDAAAIAKTTTYMPFFEEAIPLKAVKFINGRSSTGAIKKRLKKVYDDDRHRKLLLAAVMAVYKEGDDGEDVRMFQALNGRCAVKGASRVFTNSRGLHDTKITGAGFTTQLSNFFGRAVPGSEDLPGAKCACRGTSTVVDQDHVFVCSASGRSSVHNNVRDVLAKLTRNASPDVGFVRKEVRGDKYYYEAGDNRGPDIELRVGDRRVFIDVTGVAEMSAQHRRRFQGAQTTANHTKRSVVVGSDFVRNLKSRVQGKSPVDAAYDMKMKSEDARVAQEHGARYYPAVFCHNGGIDYRFSSLLITCFGHADHEHEYAWGSNITSALEHAQQAVTASIVNGHARYVIANQKRLFKRRGQGDVALRWWATANSTATTTMLPDGHRTEMAAEYAATYGDEDDENQHGRRVMGAAVASEQRRPTGGAAASRGAGRTVPQPGAGGSSGRDRGVSATRGRGRGGRNGAVGNPAWGGGVGGGGAAAGSKRGD